MNVMAFAASSSTKSINKKLVTYAASLIGEDSVDIVDLNEYELPLFSEDKEGEIGKPELAKYFLDKINNSDALIISFAEHNGSYTAAYKNLFDWCSRINPKVYQNKPMLLFSTSPGPGGASNVLNSAVNSMPHFNGVVKGSFSFPKFYDNFDLSKNTISNDELDSQFKNLISTFVG